MTRSDALKFCYQRCFKRDFGYHLGNILLVVNGNQCICTYFYPAALVDRKVYPPSQCEEMEFRNCNNVSNSPFHSFYNYHQKTCTEPDPMEIEKQGIELLTLYDCPIHPEYFQTIIACGSVNVNRPLSTQSVNLIYRQFHTYVKQNSPENCMRSCLMEGHLQMNDFKKYTFVIALGEQGIIRPGDGVHLNCGCYFVDHYFDIHWNYIEPVNDNICMRCSDLDTNCTESQADEQKRCGGYHSGWQQFLISVYQYTAKVLPEDCREYVPPETAPPTTTPQENSTSPGLTDVPTSPSTEKIVVPTVAATTPTTTPPPPTEAATTTTTTSPPSTVPATTLPPSTEAETTTTSTTPPSTEASTSTTTEIVTTVGAELTTVVVTACNEDSVKCSATDKFGESWEGCAGEIVSHACTGENTTGTAVWKCLLDGNFDGRYPDYRGCSSYWIGSIETFLGTIATGETLTPNVTDSVLMQIQEKYEKSKESNGTGAKYFGHEIKRIFEIGKKVLKLVDETTETGQFENLTYKSMWIVGNVFTYLEPWDELDTATGSETGLSFILNMEESVLELTTRILKNATYMSKGKYERAYDYFGDFNVGCGARFKSGTKKDKISFPFEYSPQKDSYMELPADWAKYFSGQKVEFAGMQIDSEYVNRIFPGNLSTLKNFDSGEGISHDRPEKLVNGNLLSFSFDSNEVRDKGFNFTVNGVRIIFQHAVEAWGSETLEIRRKLHPGERAKAVLGSSSCVFWDPKNLLWSSEGCKLVESTRTKTVCECFHLTSFALLMDLHKYTGKDPVLEVLTWILSSLSIICLTFCIIFFSTCVKSGRTPRNEITTHLCVWLLIGNVTLLLFMDRNYFYLSEGMCTAIGILLHYGFLTVFMWNAVEGLQLYRMVIVVFDNGKDYMNIQRMVAYGLPAIIVTITGVTGISKSEKAYGGDAFCWLEDSYMWAFIVPVAIITLGNLILLILCMRKAYDLQHNPKIPQANRKQKPTTSWVKATLSLCCLLGVTWGFGFLMLSPSSGLSNFAAYLFTILNASQGILLFIFHGWMNQNVRDGMKRHFPRLFQISRRQRGKAGSGETSTSILF